MRCENCRFAKINWRKDETYMHHSGSYFAEPTEQVRLQTSVQCRRHAPQKAAMENDCDGWPYVDGDDWCGEFQPTQEEE